MDNDLISRSALKAEFLRYKPYAVDFLFLIDNAPTVPQINILCENADEKAIADMKEELQKVIDDLRPQGVWLVTAEDNDGVHRICCPFCSYEKGSNNTNPIIVTFSNFPKFCENCGADMRGVE